MCPISEFLYLALSIEHLISVLTATTKIVCQRAAGSSLDTPYRFISYANPPPRQYRPLAPRAQLRRVVAGGRVPAGRFERGPEVGSHGPRPGDELHRYIPVLRPRDERGAARHRPAGDSARKVFA